MELKKVKNQKEILKIIKVLKKKGKKIVALSGSFDILHFGHIKSLKEAKTQGDVLIVLLNSDKSVKSYKGPQRPINSQKERAEVLSALDCVDYVTIFNELTPVEILKKIKPDVFCNDSDWGKNCIERKTVEENGGKIHLLKRLKSSSELIKKILALYSKPSIRAVFLDRDGTLNVNQPPYLHKIEDFKLTPLAIPALKKLSKTDYKIIIITNQSGIGRGYFKEKDLKKLHQWMEESFKKKGVRIDKIYYCPHIPGDNCSCRKPKTGLPLQAVKDFNISLSKSWLIGDDVRDILMGRNINIKTIFLGTKKNKDFSKLKVSPHYLAKNLLEAVNIILKSEEE